MRYSAKCSRKDPTVKRNKEKKTISSEKVKRLSITIDLLIYTKSYTSFPSERGIEGSLSVNHYRVIERLYFFCKVCFL